MNSVYLGQTRAPDIGPWEPDKRWKEALAKLETNNAEAERVLANAHDYVRVLGNDGKMHSLDKLADLLKKGNDK